MIGRPSKDGQLALPLSNRSKRRGESIQRSLPVAGLFAGIGGFELGLSRAGHETVLLCEIDAGANAVLAKHFRSTPLHEDVTTLESLPKSTQLITAGFPCQDLSQAGQTRGIRGRNSGLIGEVFRLIQGQQVPYVLLENVPFMRQLSRGRALDVIVSTLESLGYHWAYRTVDSRSFGVPQRRRRVFLLACLEEDPRHILFSDQVDEIEESGVPEKDHIACGFYWTEGTRGLGWAVNSIPTLKGGSTIGIPSPPAIWLPNGDIVKPSLTDAERLQGFRKDWTKPAEKVGRRSHRWKLVGNAVTVDVARWLGDRLACPGWFEPTLEAQRLTAGASWPLAAWNVGDGRFTDKVSTWPRKRRLKDLQEFLLAEPELLSEKATRGFLSRARASSLRFPEGFLEAVEGHLSRVSSS